MDQKFSWSFIGVLLALAFGGFSLYLEYYKEEKPNLRYVVKENISVLDIRENLGSLDVLYEGESLRRNKKDLRVITIEVENQGNASVLTNFYDEKDPVGFNVINGYIADKPKIIHTSNNYLNRELKLEKESDTKILFPRVIIDKGDSFLVKLFVLHKSEDSPEIQPIGKIAGMSPISISNDYEARANVSFLSATFSGKGLEQVVRLIAYGFAALVILGLFIATTEFLDTLKEKLKRKKDITIYKEYHNDNLKEEDSLIFEIYKNNHEYLFDIYETLSNKENFSDFNENFLRGINSSDSDENTLATYEIHYQKIIIASGLVRESNSGLTLDEERVESFSKFAKFIAKRSGRILNRKNRNSSYLDYVMRTEFGITNFNMDEFLEYLESRKEQVEQVEVSTESCKIS